MSHPRQESPTLESVTTIRDDGSRFFLHPADVRGRFTSGRRLFGALLLLVYAALPWITINGHPAVFFDLLERRFHLFGLTFLAPDFWLAFFVVSGFGFALFYLTALFGRLWCGWACPYTVFLDHLFRRVERWIDGDAPARRALEKAPWSANKLVKRFIKHGLFFLISALIAHFFLAYFVSIPRLYSYMQQSPLEHLPAFGVVVFLTGALYFSFSWFREQFCIILCPYGRIQSALTDENTLIIGYDERRGEPRGKRTDPTAGDCIDCLRCVKVCPTGIDIRNGLQMECIGCAACIDACDDVMTRIERPRGLIRYDSLNGLSGGKTRFIRPRIILYSGLMALGAAALVFSLTKVHDVHAGVTRMRGSTFYVDANGVRNQYNIRLSTKRNEETRFQLSLADPPVGITAGGLQEVTVEGQSEATHPLFISIDKEHYTGPATLTLRIEARPGGTLLEKKLQFLGPAPYLLNPPENQTP